MIDVHQKVKALIKTGESDVELGKYGINLSPLSGAVISVE
jgi:hypothetical protein